MSYKKFVISIAPKNKPRGQLGKYGNMTHSAGGYRSWQATFLKQLRSIAGQPFTYQKLMGVVILHSRKPGRGLPDVENLAGAVLDTLKEAKWIKDDNFKIIPRLYSDCIERNFEAIEIYLFPVYPNWKGDFMTLISESLLKEEEELTITIKTTKKVKK